MHVSVVFVGRDSHLLRCVTGGTFYNVGSTEDACILHNLPRPGQSLGKSCHFIFGCGIESPFRWEGDRDHRRNAHAFMEGTVPDRLDTFPHPLEALLLSFTRSTTCRVFQVHGFGVTNVLPRTPHDPNVIRRVISLWNPRAILARKTVGPFNLNRGQDLSLPSVEPTDAFSASTSSTDVGHMSGINRPVWCTI